MKIRGTASHIAEKYVTLARDAQASGDPISAENYLQHAEHYFRIIAAAQAQMTPQQPFFRDEGSREDDLDNEGDEELYVNGAPVPGLGPQPIVASAYQRDYREPGREPFAQREPAGPPYVPHGNGQQAVNGFGHDLPAERRADTAFEPGGTGEMDDRNNPRRRRRGRRRPAVEGAGGAAEPANPAPEGDNHVSED